MAPDRKVRGQFIARINQMDFIQIEIDIVTRTKMLYLSISFSLHVLQGTYKLNKRFLLHLKSQLPVTCMRALCVSGYFKCNYVK